MLPQANKAMVQTYREQYCADTTLIIDKRTENLCHTKIYSLPVDEVSTEMHLTQVQLFYFNDDKHEEVYRHLELHLDDRLAECKFSCYTCKQRFRHGPAPCSYVCSGFMKPIDSWSPAKRVSGFLASTVKVNVLTITSFGEKREELSQSWPPLSLDMFVICSPLRRSTISVRCVLAAGRVSSEEWALSSQPVPIPCLSSLQSWSFFECSCRASSKDAFFVSSTCF